MKTSIRTATLTDIDELARLFNGYRMFYEQASDVELARSFLSERINNSESTVFMACDENNQGYGFTQLFRSFSSVSARPIWILNDLYVDTNARRKGIGRALMNRARDFAVETGSKGILLETGRLNVNAQALYESLGYEKNAESFYYFLTLAPA